MTESDIGPTESRTMPGDNRHSLTDKASLSGVRRQIRADLNRLGVDPSISFDCLVAVTEACTNALLHGYPAEGLHPEISWEIEDDCALFYIRDFSGQQWSMSAHPSRSRHRAPTAEMEERIGGYGIAIMRDLMDDVTWNAGREGTVVMLKKELR